MVVDAGAAEPSAHAGRPGEVPRLCPGTRLLGAYEGSGFIEERFLVARQDHQVVHLPPLLYLVLQSIDGRRRLAEVAARVSSAYGRQLTVEGLQHLIVMKLGPLGLVEAAAAEPGQPSLAGAQRAPRAAPLLALRLRAVILPAPAVGRVAGWFAPLFTPVVVAAVLGAVVVVDTSVMLGGDITAALRRVAPRPELILAVLALLVAATLFHELGHAAGCRYGGGRPGVIGVGVYLIVPAFYTNVTDAYRLDRRGRLRTDLGGLYFNAVSLLALGVGYLYTGYAPLLVVIALTHLEMLQQLVPVVRLDGYFILADLVGVPDLFGRVRPILAGLLPGRGPHPAVRELRPRVRVVVTGWVLLVVPLLTVASVLLLWQVPQMIGASLDSMRLQWGVALGAVGDGRYAVSALAVFSLLMLAPPLAGLLLLAGHLLARLAALLPVTVAPRPVGRPRRVIMDFLTEIFAHPAHPETDPDRGPRSMPLTAESFNEELYLRRRYRPPRHGWRRLVYRFSGGAVNVGPSRAERRELELVSRVRTPIRGSRRVVVLCRKGGAGKTTTALMLGHTFAQRRGDRVVALDANPDAGSLAHRIRRETAATVTTLLNDRALIDRYSDVRSYTSQAPTRLEVVASDDDPRISQALGEADYQLVIDVLDRHYNLVLLDTGTGILDDAIQGILKQADQIVLVMSPALDGARVAAATLDWLDEHGYGWLVRGAVAVLNGVKDRGLVELGRVEQHFAQRCAATVRIPWDPTLEAGAQTSLEELRRPTRTAYLRLAAAVAEGFRAQSERPGRP